MSDITNTSDIIDIRDVIERVEELREQRSHRYAVGFNMPGYMPESDPAKFDDADDARASLAEEMRRSAETEEESAEELEDAANALEILSSEEEGAEWGRTIGQFHYWLSYDGLDADEKEELETLEGLLSDLEGYSGDEQWDGSWYPVMLIRESYFQEYAQELADDIGAIPKGAGWPCTCIDWEQAARALLIDYSSVEYDGVTYWYR